METWEKIAREMLDIPSYEDIPQPLFDDLEECNKLCKRANGGLVSRQVIASIILAWRHTGSPVK